MSKITSNTLGAMVYYNEDEIIEKFKLENLLCSFCENIPLDPKCLKDGRNYVYYCAHCLDKKSINDTVPIPPIVLSKFQNLTVHCIYRDYGCLESIKVSFFENHINTCKDRVTQCNKKVCDGICTELTKPFNAHFHTHCKYADIGCWFYGNGTQVNRHESFCPIKGISQMILALKKQLEELDHKLNEQKKEIANLKKVGKGGVRSNYKNNLSPNQLNNTNNPFNNTNNK